MTLVLMLGLIVGLPGRATVSSAAGAAGVGEVTPQSDDAVPARNVIMLGASPDEAPGETWGIGEVGSTDVTTFAIVRYTSEADWTPGPGILDATGQPVAAFAPAPTPLTGQLAANGAGVLVGTAGATRQKVILVRNPGGSFQERPLPTEGEAALGAEEALYSESRTPLFAALDEGGHAGALLVPVNRGSTGNEDRVLHWNGERWSAEPIEVPEGAAEGFRVLAIAASSPTQAWLLAQLSGSSRSLALFRRTEGHWTEATPAPLAQFSVPGVGSGTPVSKGQILTVSEQGVWIDGEQTEFNVPVTIFFKPTSPTADSGEVAASWCDPGQSFAGCSELEQALPTGPSRSFAWANQSTPYGERVITGLGEGVSLRLEGTDFKRILSLGGSAPPNDVGGTLGAAFSSAREGWLGNELLPVHLTLDPAPDRLAYYPVPFSHALTAIAPQPGMPVGAGSSEAVAVGDDGEVARFEPGQGWEPETLFGPGGRHETPRLRAVAWPTPQRAYAVGEEGQMWLWRGETGLWESDPATPLNFQGDLLGIAFNPANPAVGYAVGQQGVLLRYGKTWTQEPEEDLPDEARGASFSSIAFAGSEALVAFRKIHLQTTTEGTHYTGGVLVNDGSGWQIDESASGALAGEVPWAVAGLPDGGAAVSATQGGLGGTSLILERESQTAPWQPTPATYPGFAAPGSLALFREGGALRVVGSGGLPETRQVDDVREPPQGFPPTFIRPYPVATGYVIRQTPGGWSDEEHQRDNAQDPLGEYKSYDMVYQPDPTSAVLIDETGTHGWAVGGSVDESQPTLDTSDVARYPADGLAPPGLASSPVASNPALATFAIGGGAQCQAACAERARARIGPDVWLSSALEQARQIAGVRAFLYTGPRVTTGEGHGVFPVPYRREFARYAELLGGSAATFAAASPTDRGPGSECAFEEQFGGFPFPFGGGASVGGEPAPSRSGEACRSYYAFTSSGAGGSVRVIVIDTSSELQAAQLSWLAGQLAQARGSGQPAIVVGNADLNAQIAAGEANAAAVAETLVSGYASAYFYDAPEVNVKSVLTYGSRSIPAFGSGTLGYISAVNARLQNFIGASGFLLAEVGPLSSKTGLAAVAVRLIPNDGELAMEAEEGTLLRRSNTALFQGLARRPRAGGVSQRSRNTNESDPYIPIPANCVGNQCANGIFPEYTFTSSRPDIGDFVGPNLATGDLHSVLLGPEEKPIPDPKSGLFCAYNAGKTVVTISAGGLSSSLTVTVQPGSVRRPCGTQPLKELATQVSPPPSQPPPAEVAPTPSSEPPPPVPVPPVPAVPARPTPARVPFVLPPAIPATLLPFVPPPVPTPARPTPPSGTSAVTSPVEAPEKEEETEEATESVSNKAVAYSAPEHEPTPAYLLGIVVLAAFAGASVRRRPRRGRRGVNVAPATITTIHAQRRMSRRQRRLP